MKMPMLDIVMMPVMMPTEFKEPKIKAKLTNPAQARIDINLAANSLMPKALNESASSQ